jgi:hypothetical protein
MDRPKHRWFIILGLLVGCALLLLARPWISKSAPADALQRAISTAPGTSRVEHMERRIEAVTPAATPGATRPSSETGSFRGRVIDAVTRQSIVEFEILMQRVPPGSEREEAPATQSFKSSAGRFAWKNLREGLWQATVKARGYQPFKVQELSIAAGKSTREVVLPLIRGHRLSGRVFDAGSGAGLSGASLTLREMSAAPNRGDESMRFEKANDDGSFVLEGVPAGDIELTANAPKHASRDVEVTVDDETPPVEIGLSTGGTIAGSVVADGKPVGGSIFLSGPYAMGTMRRLDETGTFSFEHRRPGRYSLSVSTTAGNAMREIVLEEGQPQVNVPISITTTGRSIRGTVTGLRPEQLKQSSVSLRLHKKPGGFNARLDEQGGYVLSNVPSGSAQLTAHGGGWGRQLHKNIDVPADKDLVIDIAFPPGARLSGRVTQDGKPAFGKHIWMAPVGSGDSAYQAHTKENGRYEIEGLVAGEYQFRADEDVSRTITIAGDTTLDIDIPSVQIGGRVIEDGSGIPIVGADVFLQGMEASARVSVRRTTDHFGRFTLIGVEPGEVMLVIYKPGYEMHREPFAYTAPRPDQTIRLRRSSGVEIRVRQVPGHGAWRGVSLFEKLGNEPGIVLWVPLNREGIGSLPSALIGSTLVIVVSPEPIWIREWDGQPLDVQL